jgi:hypothetical protein
MDKKTHDKGLEIHKALLGEDSRNLHAGSDLCRRPAGVDSFRIAREVSAEADNG